MRLRGLLLLLLAGCGIGIADPVISDVVNYGSRIGTGLPSAGIAQGALFAVTGSGLGPEQAVTAGFPLPTTDGLGGVTVTIQAGGSTANAILVVAGFSEVAAILPSSTPLGAATVTVSYNGVTVSAPITVVASAFGIFANAGVFNVADDGSYALNTPFQSAVPGQTVTITGTGLGAIPSDETQSGVTDVPAPSNITVWVGTTQATIVSAGRGACCTGANPAFSIPQGIAAEDVIAFTMPDGVQGCRVSIVVQIDNFVSNVTMFSAAAGGGTCLEASTVNGGNPVVVTGLVKSGLITTSHILTVQKVGTVSVNTLADTGTANFYPVDYKDNQVTIPSYSANLQASAGSCTVSASRVDTSIKLDPPPMSGDPAPPVLPLDAGPFLTLTAPNATKTLKLQNGIYSGTEVISSIQVLPNLPPTVTGGPDFLPEGPYTLDNGAGGADIGPFTATLRNPVRVIWDSMSDNTNIDRSKGVTVKWSGGDASNSVVTITGVSSSYQPPIAYSGIFVCFARVDAGQFTVPAFVTQQLPPSPAQPAGSVLSVGTMLADLPIINGVDVTYSIAQQTTGTPVVFK